MQILLLTLVTLFTLGHSWFTSFAVGQEPAHHYVDVTVDPPDLHPLHVLKGVSITVQVHMTNNPLPPDYWVKSDIDSQSMVFDGDEVFYGTVYELPWKYQIDAPRANSKARVTGYNGLTYDVWYSGNVSGVAGSTVSEVTLNPTLNWVVVPGPN